MIFEKHLVSQRNFGMFAGQSPLDSIQMTWTCETQQRIFGVHIEMLPAQPCDSFPKSAFNTHLWAFVVLQISCLWFDISAAARKLIRILVRCLQKPQDMFRRRLQLGTFWPNGADVQSMNLTTLTIVDLTSKCSNIMDDGPFWTNCFMSFRKGPQTPLFFSGENYLSHSNHKSHTFFKRHHQPEHTSTKAIKKANQNQQPKDNPKPKETAESRGRSRSAASHGHSGPRIFRRFGGEMSGEWYGVYPETIGFPWVSWWFVCWFMLIHVVSCCFTLIIPFKNVCFLLLLPSFSSSFWKSRPRLSVLQVSKMKGVYDLTCRVQNFLVCRLFQAGKKLDVDISRTKVSHTGSASVAWREDVLKMTELQSCPWLKEYLVTTWLKRKSFWCFDQKMLGSQLRPLTVQQSETIPFINVIVGFYRCHWVITKPRPFRRDHLDASLLLLAWTPKSQLVDFEHLPDVLHTSY